MKTFLKTLFGFNKNSQVVMSDGGASVSIADSMSPAVSQARYKFVKTRTPNRNGFDHLRHLPVQQQKMKMFEVMRENVFYYTKQIIPGMHWTLDGPNAPDHSRLPRNHALNRLRVDYGRNTVLGILPNSPDRIERLERMKEEGKGCGPSCTTNYFYVTKWAEFFTKELGYTVTTDDLIFPAIRKVNL